MMKKGKEDDQMTKSNDQTTPGRVKQICQHFLIHSDSGLAHRLQEEEFARHFDRNRTHRRESHLGVTTARVVEEEEKQAFVAKQFDFYQRKHTIEENDVALAKQLQDEIEIKSNSTDQLNSDIHHYASNDQNCYEDIDQPVSYYDTSCDEQLAQILQEEERLLSSAAHRSHYKSTSV